MIKRDIHCEITPTPIELAIEFCNMDSEQQVQFFNEIASIVIKEWEKPFVFQLQSITDEELLTNEARSIMRNIGEYSEKYNQ